MRAFLSLAISLFVATAAHALPDAPAPAVAPVGLECVPVARALSGIQIRGNALTWWDQAEGRYDRGHAPRRGAVLAFIPHGAMALGHVATVSRIIDDHTILITHSNWSPINGRRGQIERDVKVIDVSPSGDWSAVRVWFAPLQDLGTTVWPVHGFIYPGSTPPMKLIGPVLPSPSSEVHDKPTGRLNYLGPLLRRYR